MPTANIVRQISVGGISYSGSTSRTEGGLEQHEVTLDAGQAGAISASGIDGLGTGHGITAADIVDVHWTASGVQKCRYGITVDTDDTNAITFDDTPAAAGDALPAEDTAVVVCVQQEIDVDLDMNNAKTVAVLASKNAHLAFTNDDPVVQLGVKAKQNVLWIWNEGEGFDNPFLAQDDDVLDVIKASNGSATAGTLKVAILFDNEA